MKAPAAIKVRFLDRLFSFRVFIVSSPSFFQSSFRSDANFVMGCLPSFSPVSLNFQSDLLIFMILDDRFSPIPELTDFLSANRLIPLSTR